MTISGWRGGRSSVELLPDDCGVWPPGGAESPVGADVAGVEV